MWKSQHWFVTLLQCVHWTSGECGFKDLLEIVAAIVAPVGVVITTAMLLIDSCLIQWLAAPQRH